jgi:hypothetical protein
VTRAEASWQHRPADYDCSELPEAAPVQPLPIVSPEVSHVLPRFSALEVLLAIILLGAAVELVGPFLAWWVAHTWK